MPPKTAGMLVRVNAIGFALFALVWVGAAFPGLDGGARFLLDLLNWPLDGSPEMLDRNTRWLSAIGAGLTAAFAALTYFVVAPGIDRADGETRKGAVIAVATWFLVDSAGSISSGVASNALFNTLFFVLYATPLVLMRR